MAVRSHLLRELFAGCCQPLEPWCRGTCPGDILECTPAHLKLERSKRMRLSSSSRRIDPLDAANASFVDNGYPHTHMRPQLVRAVLLAHELQHRANVTFWLECGSMLGGSLIRTAHVARKLERYDGLSLVAIDPFTGDVNMWAGEARAIAANARFRFLGLRNGQLIWDTG